MRTTHLRLLLCTVLAFACPAPGPAATPKVKEYRFKEVLLLERGGTRRKPDRFQAGTTGGQLTATNLWKSGCRISYTFRWKFEGGGITRLSPGGSYRITVEGAGSSGPCKPRSQPFLEGRTSVDLDMVRQVEAKIGGRIHAEFEPRPPEAKRVYAAPVAGRPDMITRKTYTVKLKSRPTGRFVTHVLRVEGSTDRYGAEGKSSYLIVYVLEAVYETVATRPPGGGPGAGRPAGAAGTGPAPPPAGYHRKPAAWNCLHAWMGAAQSMKNRYGPRGHLSWNLNQYLAWSRGFTNKGGKPAGWKSKYQESRTLWAWDRFASEHREPFYRGELPPYREYMSLCWEGRAPPLPSPGPAPPPSPSPPPSPPPPGIPPGPPPPTMPAPSPPTPTAPTRTLLVPGQQAAAGDDLELTVRIRTPAGLANMDFTLRYSPAVMRAVGEPRRGPALPAGAVLAANRRTPGLVHVSLASASGMRGDGALLVLPCRAVGGAGAVSPLELKVHLAQSAGGHPVEVGVVPGRFAVVGGGFPGDCDEDGRVSRADALCAVEMASGARPARSRADADRDGAVTSGDARVLLRGGR